MITADEPIRGRDLRSCNECGALMPGERGGMHEEFHARIDARDATRARGIADLVQVVRGFAQLIERKRPRWFR